VLKTSSIYTVVSIQYRLVTDGRAHDDSIFRASIVSRGKNYQSCISMLLDRFRS